MDDKNNRKIDNPEPNVSNQSRHKNPAGDGKSGRPANNSSSKPPLVNAISDPDQDKKMRKRKRDSENSHSVKKRRSSSCPQKFNKVNQLVSSQSATPSPTSKPVRLDVDIPVMHTTYCPERMDSEDDRVQALVRDKQELSKKNDVLHKELERRSLQMVATRKKLHKREETLSCCRDKLIEVLRHNAVMERKLREEKLERQNRQIGGIVQRQNNFGTHIDVWQNGERFKDF